MKKQTKTQKTGTTKMAHAMDRAVVVHNRRQRFWGVIALAGLFFCGFMLGMDIQHKRVKAPVATEQQNVVYQNEVDTFESKTTCEKIETLLLKNLADDDDTFAGNHVWNAKVYANLSERGCPENRNKFVELAKQELEIARALEDDRMGQEETIEVVETYKRIQMQQAAQEILDKAKKIANPTIDFIIELERIINE